ncbi:hemicentin-1-like [Acanthopagrus schlegelii]
MELLPLVCLCLLSCSGDAVRVVVEEGSDAVLPCWISTEEDISGKLFDWKKDGQKDGQEVFLYDTGVHSNNGLPGQDDQFKGRVSFFQDQLQNGNASIEITRTKMADSGTYSCDFPRHQPRQTSFIELVVAVRVVVEEGSDAVLPCLISPEEDISGKYFVWRKDGQKEVFLYDAGNHYNNGLPGQDDQFKGRVSFFQDQLQNGDASIKITRTKMADSGTYSCDFPRRPWIQTSIIELVVAVRVVVEEDSDAVLPCLIRTKEDLSGKYFVWRKDGQQEVFMYDAGVHSNNGLPGQDDQFRVRVSFFQDQLKNGDASIKINDTKMADSGIYSCDFPRHQPRQTFIIELVVARVRVVVEQDSDAVLPCLIRTKEDITGKLFHWVKDGQNVFLYNAGIDSQGEQFKGRVSVFQDQLKNGNASIKITGTKMADSGIYSCDFPRHQPRQTSIIELVVDQVLKDRTGENIPGAAPEPVIKIVAVTKDGVLLQCDARGVPPLTVEWKNAAGNILKSESTPISETGSHSSITLNITVTKNDNYSCVATQKQFSHQVAAVTSVYIQAVRVVVEEDSDAVLPCLISTEEDITGELFDWRKDGQKQVFMYDAGNHYNNGLPGQDDQFKDRVSHFQDQLQNGDASIKIIRTKMADSGNYSCDFPRHQPSQTSIIELVVDPVLRERLGENIPGAALEPNIKILDETNHWRLLQCEAHGDPLPTLEWKDSDNNTLPADTPQISDRGGRSYITVNVTVTKTDNYSCVATQETLGHQIAAVTSVRLTAVRVVVEEDSDAVLPCLISTEEDLSGKYFVWRKDGQKKKEVFMYDAGVHYNNGRQGQDDQFKGRVSHFQDQLQNGNASIKITRTKMADSGNYSCDFPRHQPRQTSIIELVVARVRVDVKEDSDAVLPCLISPKEDITGKAFDWKKDGQDVFFNDPAGHTAQGQNFRGRVSHFQDQLQNGDASITIRKTKKTDSGNYSCIFPHLQSQTSIIELFVEQVLKDRTGEVSGASSKPYVRTVITDDGVILQCEVLGASPKPKVEWKDSSGNILQTEEPQVTESGGGYDIVLRAAVTKTDTFRCVVTQEEISHQTEAETYASVSGAAPKPYISTLRDTKYWRLLLCEARGVPPLTVEWKNAAGNILNSESTPKSETGSLSSITLNINVTKTDDYSCVATQKQFSHQIAAVTSVYIQAVRVVVEEDSDAVLPCLISTEEDISYQVFDWRKDGQKKKEVFLYDAGVHYNNGLPGQDDQFKGRVSFFQDQLQNGDASIKITRTKMADSGTYRCDFPRHQPRQTSIIELVVAVRVVVEEDSDAVLPCLISTEEDLSYQVFDWKKDGQKGVFLYDAGVHYKNGLPGQDEQFKGRVSFFQDQLENGDASIKITGTKMADSGTYSCDFPRHQPSQTSIIELVVGRVLKDRTGENIPGAAPRPFVETLDVTNDWALLQCEAHGDPLPTLEWKDSDDNTLPADTPQISDRGGRSYITVNVTVTKTDNYSCVATQETLGHQIPASTYVCLTAVRVDVKEGSDAVLNCSLSTKEDLSGKYFDWRKDGQKEVFMYDAGVHSNNGLPGQDEQFKGRVSFFQDQLENGDASIEITRTKMADSGTYSCDFPRHQPRQTSIIELVVARVRVVVEEDSDAVLPCLISPKEDITRKTFDWKKDGQKEKQEVFMYDAGKNDSNRGQDEQFKGRVSHFEDQLKNGDASIKITRTKMADSGTYSCIFPHHQPSQTSIIELVVGASKPSVKTIKTDKGVMLQCEVLGASPKPKVEWKDSSGNILQTEEPQVTESGGIVLRAAVTKTDTFRCVVTQEEISHQTEAETYASVSDQVLRDRTGENDQGAASEPYVRTIQTDDGMVLQCKVVGASPKPKVEWKDSSGNILQAEEPQVTERGGRYDIVLRAAVTKTDTFRCVVTQEEISHQIYAETDAAVSVPPPESGSNTGLIVAVVVLCLLLVAAVVYHFKDRIRQICALDLGSTPNTANGPPAADSSHAMIENYSGTIVFSADAE